jgi:hypothetical protein
MSAGPTKRLQRRNGLKLPASHGASERPQAALEPGPDRELAGLRRMYWGVTKWQLVSAGLRRVYSAVPLRLYWGVTEWQCVVLDKGHHTPRGPLHTARAARVHVAARCTPSRCVSSVGV